MFNNRKKKNGYNSDLKVQLETIKEHQRVLNRMTNPYNSYSSNNFYNSFTR